MEPDWGASGGGWGFPGAAWGGRQSAGSLQRMERMYAKRREEREAAEVPEVAPAAHGDWRPWRGCFCPQLSGCSQQAPRGQPASAAGWACLSLPLGVLARTGGGGKVRGRGPYGPGWPGAVV